MNLWAILATAGVGLIAGQIGAWLQSRRDADADRRRQLAETERLRLQLADSREQQRQDRDYKDVLEWRERRLTVYQTASKAIHDLYQATYEFTLHAHPELVTLALGRIRKAAEILDAQLEQCAIIGTKDTRMAALKLQSTVEDLLYRASKYESHASAMSADPSRGSQLFAKIARDRRQRFGTSKPAPDEPEYLAVDKLAKEFGEPDDWLIEHCEDWRAVARAELGVPD
ncbi:hypothetical protein [Kribbella sp. NPDC051137]|uniref:hypothetical protein n=1 Tax=Kribbella sp. NPDC051137 TaxID=3155045 RepID=UPI00342771B6